MKFLVISDVHSNYDALKAVMQKANRIGYDSVIFLGDAVGYGADPNECIELLREISNVKIIGNHDKAIIDPREIYFFNPVAKEALLWTRSIIKQENVEWLNKLELYYKFEDIAFTHASLSEPESWRYVFSVIDAMYEFKNTSEWLIFFGHTHIPGVFVQQEGEIEYWDGTSFLLESKYRFLVNPGSVGQPRDGDERASFAVLDTEKRLLNIYRVEYNIKRQAEKILKAGLPEYLAHRLYNGY